MPKSTIAVANMLKHVAGMKLPPASSPLRARVVAQLMGGLLFFAGAIALAAWWLKIESLKCIVPGSTPLKPNIAAGFFLSGVGLFLLLSTRSKVARLGAATIGAIICMIGLLTIGEHFLGWNIALDELLVPGLSALAARMQPTTAFCFTLAGAALLAQTSQTRTRLCVPIVGGIAAALATIGIISLLGFFLEKLAGPRWNVLGMSLSGITAAAGFLVLGIGLLALLSREEKLNWFLNRWTTVGFGLGLLLTIFTTASAFTFAGQMLKTNRLLAQRQEVLKEIEKVSSNVENLNNHERVYVITGNEQLLTGRAEANAALQQDMLDIQNLNSGDAEQLKRLEQLRDFVAKQKDWEESVITARREAGFAKAGEMIASGRGLELVGQIQTVLKEMRQKEYESLASNQKQAQTASTATFLLLPFGVLVTLATLLLGLSFLNTGVGERVEAEARLKKSLRDVNDLRTALDQHAIVAITDAQGKITHANDKFCAISKFSREELIGQDHRIINSGYHSKEFIRGLWQTIARGKVWKAEMKNRAKDGSYYWVDTTIVPFLNEKGKPHHYVAIRADITERKRIEEEIRHLNAELEERVAQRTAELEAANKELESFSYSVSHDLRAPLRAVDGFSQAALEDFGPQLPKQGKHYLQTIREGAQRMGNLIDDLLTFSRLSRLPLNRQLVNTKRIVNEALAELREQEANRPVELQVGDLPICEGDPALLKQVWLNLLSNALKYTRKRDGAKIDIGSKSDDGNLIYYVADNGTGFDMQYAGKLFGVFQRLHRAEEFEGTGVGLAIVQRVIHRHGGRVWAEAKPNHGATFYFTLETPNRNGAI